MEIEELKLILETLNNAGEGAFWIAAFWLGSSYLKIILTSATIIAIIAIVYKLIKRCAESQYVQHARLTRETARVCNRGPITPHEETRVLELIEKGRKYEKQSRGNRNE